jgi:hypothetical protein
LVQFMLVLWLWSFGRRTLIHGLDYVVRQPGTLGFIMIIMYILAWQLLEIAMAASGGYDPYTGTFGDGGSADGFLMILMLLASLLCCMMWGGCAKAAAKYSKHAQEVKWAKIKAKNPYADRSKKKGSGASGCLAMIFCTCGAESED